MDEKKLTDSQAAIIEAIVNNSIETISYNKPQMQLGDVVKDKGYDETLDALGGLEKEFGVLSFDPILKFGLFNTCGYHVINLDRAKELYDSYSREKRE